MYQGIFDTDFDRYTRGCGDAVHETGIDTVFEKLEGSRGLEDEPDGIDHVRPRPSMSQLLEYGEYPYVSADEVKKALKLKAAFSNMLDLMQ